MTILYGDDPDAGMVEMERLLPDCRDAEVLAGMVENVMSDLEAFSRGRHAELARALARRVRELGPADFPDRQEVDEFLSLFGDTSR